MKDKEAAPQQRPRPGGTRCPFCHEACEPDAGACACAECLARHHRTCWDESGGCATCRGTQRLEATAPAREEHVGPYAEVIDAWVRLGLVYNAGLVLVTLLSFRTALLSPRHALEVAAGAFVANLCFLLGPAIELAARRLGYRGVLLRWFLFVPGFLLALLLALLSSALPLE